MDIFAVINNYNYDCSWVTRLPFQFEMMSNHGLKPGEATNFCYDTVNYLRYIIQNYDDLHDITWFFHGHEYGWHYKGYSLLYLIKDIKYDKDYHNISFVRNDYYFGITQFGYDYCVFHQNVIQKLHDKTGYFEPLLKIQTGTVVTKFNSEFYVKKECIRRHPVDFYQKLLDVIDEIREESIEDASKCVYVFERLWNYIFTGNLIEEGNFISVDHWCEI